MNEKIIVTPTSIMAPSSFWVRELIPIVLEAPKGLDEVTAPTYVKKRLHKLAGHAGYRGVFLVDGDDEQQDAGGVEE